MADVEKALNNVEKHQTEEGVAFARAVAAGRGKALVTKLEEAMLEGFPQEDRDAVLVFSRWSQGQKFRGGIQCKLAAKLAFLQAWRIFTAIYGPTEEQSGARSKLVAP